MGSVAIQKQNCHILECKRDTEKSMLVIKQWVAVVVIDGEKTKNSQALALQIESKLHTRFRDHDNFDKNLSLSSSGKLVKESKEKGYYFVVYVALKEVLK